MSNNNQKLHGCINYIMQPRNFDPEKCNLLNNPNATVSLKSLAKQYLERNWRCNSGAIQNKSQCNLVAQNLDNILNAKYGISLQ
jgi:hypothetical protein